MIRICQTHIEFGLFKIIHHIRSSSNEDVNVHSPLLAWIAASLTFELVDFPILVPRMYYIQ